MVLDVDVIRCFKVLRTISQRCGASGVLFSDSNTTQGRPTGPSRVLFNPGPLVKDKAVPTWKVSKSPTFRVICGTCLFGSPQIPQHDPWDETMKNHHKTPVMSALCRTDPFGSFHSTCAPPIPPVVRGSTCPCALRVGRSGASARASQPSGEWTGIPKKRNYQRSGETNRENSQLRPDRTRKSQKQTLVKHRETCALEPIS